jgi:hypothetical protein
VRLDIGLRTHAGEIITRQRTCLIWDVPSDEIILGGDLLRELGIEPQIALDALIISKRPKTDEARVLQDGQGNEEDEEIEDEEDVLVGCADTEEIEEQLDNLIKTARENGLPEEWVRKLSR